MRLIRRRNASSGRAEAIVKMRDAGVPWSVIAEAFSIARQYAAQIYRKEKHEVALRNNTE